MPTKLTKPQSKVKYSMKSKHQNFLPGTVNQISSVPKVQLNYPETPERETIKHTLIGSSKAVIGRVFLRQRWTGFNQKCRPNFKILRTSLSTFVYSGCSGTIRVLHQLGYADIGDWSPLHQTLTKLDSRQPRSTTTTEKFQNTAVQLCPRRTLPLLPSSNSGEVMSVLIRSITVQ
jgi:hypothetical protein